jgi:hypothetical protein
VQQVLPAPRVPPELLDLQEQVRPAQPDRQARQVRQVRQGLQDLQDRLVLLDLGLLDLRDQQARREQALPELQAQLGPPDLLVPQA